MREGGGGVCCGGSLWRLCLHACAATPRRRRSGGTCPLTSTLLSRVKHAFRHSYIPAIAHGEYLLARVPVRVEDAVGVGGRHLLAVRLQRNEELLGQQAALARSEVEIWGDAGGVKTLKGFVLKGFNALRREV